MAVKSLRLPEAFANKYTLISILKSFSNSGELIQGMCAHALIVKYGFTLDPLLGNTLLSMYAKFGLFHDANKVLYIMPYRNSVTWTIIITSHAKHAHHDKVLALYKQLATQDFVPNEVILVCVVNACTCNKDLGNGKFIHTTICWCCLDTDMIVAGALVNMYAKHGYLDDARSLFGRVQDRSAIAWTSMISGCTDHGSGEEALELFRLMQDAGAKPDQVTFISILKACSCMRTLDFGKQCHVVLIESGIENATALDNALINMYAKCGRLEISYQLFQRMRRRDVASWSTLIAGHVQSGQPKAALEHYMHMQDEMVKPNYVTFVSIVKACANLLLLKDGQVVHHTILQDEPLVELNVASTLIDMYSKCGQVRDAYGVFASSVKKDVVLWTAMITGYAQQGCSKEALELFARMLASGYEANVVTFVAVLCVCARLAAVKEGTQIHGVASEFRLDSNVEVSTALIDMYSKCGMLEDARHVFDRLRVGTIITWTTMATAYAHHGYGQQTIELVHQMQQKGIKLDHVGLVGVIVACNNAGLVNEASHLVDSMLTDCGLVPSSKHFACVADALGRAGQVEEAEIMLKEMPFQPNDVAWRSFLGACKNPELTDYVMEKVTNFEPQSADDFVLLSNLVGAAVGSNEI